MSLLIYIKKENSMYIKIFSKRRALYIAALALMSANLLAEEATIRTPSEFITEETANSERVTQAVRVAIEEKRILEQEKLGGCSEVSEDHDEIISGSWVANLHNIIRHRIISVGAEMETIRFEDDSLWQVSYFDRYKVNNWLKDHRLYLEPNWKNSAYHYRIVNYDRNESVEANWLKQPDIYSPYARCVVDIQNNRIILNDGTSWEFSNSEDSARIWARGDLVIVGVNKGLWSFVYEYIIHNFNKDINLMVKLQD
jgi:hypothetical protein